MAFIKDSPPKPSTSCSLSAKSTDLERSRAHQLLECRAAMRTTGIAVFLRVWGGGRLVAQGGREAGWARNLRKMPRWDGWEVMYQTDAYHMDEACTFFLSVCLSLFMFSFSSHEVVWKDSSWPNSPLNHAWCTEDWNSNETFSRDSMDCWFFFWDDVLTSVCCGVSGIGLEVCIHWLVLIGIVARIDLQVVFVELPL